MKCKVAVLTLMVLCCGSVQSHTNKVYTSRPLRIWFDSPCSLKGKAVWYGGNPMAWKDGKKPEMAGNSANNADQEWESASLPIGNGSVGANIFGSISAERITLNEKSLWRGGPGVSHDASYYWNVNKHSASVLKDIRTRLKPIALHAKTSMVGPLMSKGMRSLSALAISPRWASYSSKLD